MGGARRRGGETNSASGPNAVVGGGQSNVASGNHATIGGGAANHATDLFATLGGGDNNTASSTYATISGGHNNTAGGNSATVGGGKNNLATGPGATIGGGGYDGGSTAGNTASGEASTVAGGVDNHATSYGTTVAGGGANTAGGTYASAGGGYGNHATGEGATIGGGGWDGTGYSGNLASGNASTIPGGWGNSASGGYSFAAGLKASAVYTGSFVWADSTGATLACNTADQFLVRASGGVTMYTDSGASFGAALFPGSGSWSSFSDRNLKANFSGVDGLRVLDALAGIPIQTWNYQSQAATIRHMGPMAQDFHAAFGVGENDTTISTVDAQGVALAAIQGLYHLAQSQDAQLKSQRAQIDDLQTRLSSLERQPMPSTSQLPITTYQLPLLGWLLFAGLLLLNLGGLLGYLIARGRRAIGGGA